MFMKYQRKVPLAFLRRDYTYAKMGPVLKLEVEDQNLKFVKKN